MSAAHTPGPWIVVEGSESAHCCFEFSICENKPERSNSIAEVLAGNLADARLIAAAPELLEALIQMEAYVAQFSHDETGHKKIAASRAAIAKATGASE